MKKFVFAWGLLLTGFSAGAQKYTAIDDEHNGKTTKMLVGAITDSLLSSDTAFSWFSKAAAVYKPKPEVIAAFSANKDKVRFVVFMGTWCPDSHYVIPRFIKILDTIGFDKTKLTMDAVDRTKKDAERLTEKLKIINVPTIIVYNNDHEIGRVVEYGETGRFDEELAAIVKKAH